jgi:hypothetical protein
MLAIPAFRRLRQQEDLECEASLRYIERPSLEKLRPEHCLAYHMQGLRVNLQHHKTNNNKKPHTTSMSVSGQCLLLCGNKPLQNTSKPGNYSLCANGRAWKCECLRLVPWPSFVWHGTLGAPPSVHFTQRAIFMSAHRTKCLCSITTQMKQLFYKKF